MACGGVGHPVSVRWYMGWWRWASRVLERGVLWLGVGGCPTAGNLSCRSKGVHWCSMAALVMVESVWVGHLIRVGLYVRIRIVLVWVNSWVSLVCLIVVLVVAQVGCCWGRVFTL